MEKFANIKFINNRDEEVEPEHLEKAELIALLFGAYWCENSRTFITEQLSELYTYINTPQESNQIDESNVKFQIIYVNNDQNLEVFDRFRYQMPWIALKFDEQTLCHELRQEYEITTMPKLVILKPDGTIVTKDGRDDIVKDYDTAFISWGGNP